MSEQNNTSPDLSRILHAWQAATVRLEKTHESLRSEVRRLTEELEQKNRELARKNRLADLGQMAAHIAHEVRNTLVPVSLYFSLLRRKISADRSSREILDKIGTGFTALEVTVSDLLHFTADREAKLEPIDAAEVVRTSLDSLQPQLAAQGVNFHFNLTDGDSLPIDSEMLRRAIVNIVLNALDVLPSGGELHITTVMTPDRWELEIADNGPGWSEEALQRAAEPFFTTKHNGTGLGLSIVERIMESHGGELWLQNCPEGGAAITLSFPRTAVAAPTLQFKAAKQPTPSQQSVPGQFRKAA
jgi:signal transduction histidine kinase